MGGNEIEKNLKIFFQEITQRVDSAIEEILLKDTGPRFAKLVKYQIQTGGKRLRPALTLLVCRALGGKTKDAIYPAAGLEILHNYSLIIDDIIDQSALRRNQPTVWAKYGQSIAQCLAIDFSASIFQAINNSQKRKELTELFAQSLKILVEGEILDILFERRGRENEPFIKANRPLEIDKRQYLEMAGKKTAELFRCCCSAGAICADASKELSLAIQGYGYNLGIAFQIQDDILDIFGDEKSFGKKVGKDIEEKKGGNIVLLFALKSFQQKEKQGVEEIMRQKKISPAQLEKAMDLIKKTDALDKSLDLKKELARKAQSCLQVLPNSKWKNMLADLADYSIERKR